MSTVLATSKVATPVEYSLSKEFQRVFKNLQAQPQNNLSSLEPTQLKSNQEEMKNFIKTQANEVYSDRLINEFFSLGPIEHLITDTSVSEIIINGKDQICYEQRGELKKLEDHFLSALTFNNFIHQICEEAGVVLTLKQLFADGHWRGWRVHIAQHPVVPVPFHLSLRRHPKDPWTFDLLKNQDWAPEGAITLIKSLIKRKNNILICGPTSSGKTSVLNACLQSLLPNERIVTIEDSSELLLPNSFSAKLITRPSSFANLNTIEQSDLVKQCLRMRPDRIIMGETRGAEAKDLLMALATGHSGSLGTIHASDHKQALWRLEMLVQIGAPSWNTQTIRKMIALSINHIIVLDRIPSSKHSHSQRILKGIYKLSGIENTGFLFETLFVQDLKTQLQELFPFRDRGGRGH